MADRSQEQIELVTGELEDVDRQVAAGDLDEPTAEGLRTKYIAELDRLMEKPPRLAGLSTTFSTDGLRTDLQMTAGRQLRPPVSHAAATAYRGRTTSPPLRIGALIHVPTRHQTRSAHHANLQQAETHKPRSFSRRIERVRDEDRSVQSEALPERRSPETHPVREPTLAPAARACGHHPWRPTPLSHPSPARLKATRLRHLAPCPRKLRAPTCLRTLLLGRANRTATAPRQPACSRGGPTNRQACEFFAPKCQKTGTAGLREAPQ